MKALIALALLAAPLPALAQSAERQHDEIAPIVVPAGDAEMEAARARAQRSLPGFLKLLARPTAGTSGFVIKYPLPGPEHIWVSDLRLEGQVLVGKLANYPENPDFTIGQQVRVPFSAVTDWGYRDASGVMQGHFTTRVLIGRLAPEDAAKAREALGWDR